MQNTKKELSKRTFLSSFSVCSLKIRYSACIEEDQMPEKIKLENSIFILDTFSPGLRIRIRVFWSDPNPVFKICLVSELGLKIRVLNLSNLFILAVFSDRIDNTVLIYQLCLLLYIKKRKCVLYRGSDLNPFFSRRSDPDKTYPSP